MGRNNGHLVDATQSRKRNSQTQTYNNNNNNNNNEILYCSNSCPWLVLVSRHTYQSMWGYQLSERCWFRRQRARSYHTLRRTQHLLIQIIWIVLLRKKQMEILTQGRGSFWLASPNYSITPFADLARKL